MNSPRQRHLLLTLVTVVMIGSTALVATANSLADGRAPKAWVGTWAAAPAPPPSSSPLMEPLSSNGFHDQTVRMMVHTSVGGERARIRLTNRYGAKALSIGHATIALPWPDAGPGDLQPGSVHEVTFGGQKSVTIPKGGTVFSDEVTMDVPALKDVAISIYLPADTGPPTLHFFAKTTSYIGPGDNAGAASGAKLSKTVRTWYFLTGLDVLSSSGAGAIVVLGDSISDGYATTSNMNHRWTNYLATRLGAKAADHAPGILNEALSGNRLGQDGSAIKNPVVGDAASARFYEDVVGQTGVRAVILELGINDVWITHDDPDAIIANIQQLVRLAHESGLKIFACTIMPWDAYAVPGGAVQYTPALDSIRLQVNSYLRTTSDFDGLIDFDLVMRDPTAPTKLRATWDSGDHIHPNDVGNEAMAAAVPLDLLLRR
jgi:lysophospholipase L1-like esterase